MSYETVKDKARLRIFQAFKDYYFPFVSVTSEMDITKFLKEVKNNNFKFWQCFLFFLLKSCNNVDEFKYRIIDNSVIKYDKVGVGFTLLDSNNDLTYRQVEYTKDITTCVNELNKACQMRFSKKKMRELWQRLDLLYVSFVPWISHTGLITPVKSNDYSIPQITCGKYFNRDDKTLLPITYLVHHGLADGYHIYVLNKEIETNINNFSYNGK